MRIVSLSPSFTETLVAIGASDLLAATTDQCPVGAKRIGATKSLKLDEIKALGPDLILADPYENRPEQIRDIQKIGNTVLFPVRSVRETSGFLEGLGKLTGFEKAAQDLAASLEAECTRNKNFEPVKAVILLWNQPCITVNSQTYASSLLEAAGAENLFAADPVSDLPIDFDDVVDKRPELLLLASESFPFTIEDRNRFRRYPVFSRTEVELLDGLDFLRFGARTAEACKRISALAAKAASLRV